MHNINALKWKIRHLESKINRLEEEKSKMNRFYRGKSVYFRHRNFRSFLRETGRTSR